MMYQRYSSRGFACLLALSVVGILLSSLLFSCRHVRDEHHEYDVRHAQLDSVMNTIGDVDSLEALARQSHEQNDRQSEMLALRHKGDLLRLQSRYIEAIDVHKRGLEIAVDMNDTIEMAMALNSLGDDHRRLGELSDANGYYFDVLKLCDQYSDQQRDQIYRANAMSLFGISNIEMEMNNYAVADSLLHVALRYQEQLGSNIGMAMNYGALGRIKCDINEIDSAWYYLRKSQEYNQLAGNDKGVALCHLHYGELYESESNFYHAVKEYMIAYDALKSFGDIWHVIDVCLALSRVHVLLGEEDTAQTYLMEAEADARRIGTKEYEAEAHLIHYQLSLLQGNTKEALEHYVSSNELMDSIYGNQKSEIIRNQRNDYQKSRMSGEMDLLNRDLHHLKRTNTMQLLFVLLLLLMATGIIAALIYAVRVRARTQRLMRQVEETRSLFFTNVVHQLRTPLTAIMGVIDRIIGDDKNNTYSAQQQENREIIERQGKNLLMLVDRILEVGNVRSTIKELDWRTCDAVTFMHMVLESYRDSCMERHIELTYAPCENSVDIDTVPRYLNTIVSSLIENAINYSHEFGKITVTTRVDKDTLIIRVADNGMGISKDDLPHVFEPFYRSAVAESLVEGVGIGLTVVRDMTMALGGIVAVDSMKDHGSVFTVKLPCHHADGVKKRFEGNIKELLNVGKGHQHRLNERDRLVDETPQSGLPLVLVVEDHVDVARLVGLVLGNKYQLHYATDGEQGYAKALDLKPDLIITDVKMPLMDGVELCRQLRRTQQLCHIPIIILSARNADADRVRGIEAGADAYLVKPFVSEELRTWVVNLLENRKRLRAAFATGGATADGDDAAVTAASVIGNEDESKFLESFANEVDKHFTDGTKIDFDKLALVFKMGESQLRHKIQVLTGKNVPAYITQLRMEKAMRLLQNSPADTLIGDIAAQCGIQDVAYFSRVFRHYYGMTPTQARNSGK